MRHFITILLVVVFVSGSAFRRALSSEGNTDSVKVEHDNHAVPPEFLLKDQDTWVDSVFNALTPDERIAQLFMVAAYSNKDKAHVDEIAGLIRDYKIGGLIFFQGGPLRQANLTNYYQSLAKVPLMISIDGEWGLAMRLDSTVKYPRQMMLGAIQDDKLVYNMGKEIARQCKRIGIHVNLAPVVDVNVNPQNPVIGSRSFGEDKFNVARKGIAYMKGMQDQGVMANAKHFPGHGDTNTDSHKTLPVISHTRQRMDTIELYPFKKLISEGLGSMMVAHLYVPSYDSLLRATTLSEPVVTGLLKNDLGFKGLVFTDALNMKGVSAFFEPGVVDVKALLAGNDVLLFAEDVPTAISEIKNAIAANEITQAEIDTRCRKILSAKKWLGLNKRDSVEMRNLYADLNTPGAELVNRMLVEGALTLLRNKNDLIPLKRLDTLKIASLSVGSKETTAFQTMLSNYAEVTHFNVDRRPSKAQEADLLKKLKDFNLVIVGVHHTNNSPRRNYGIYREAVDLVNAIRLEKKVILDLFANPYSLGSFTNAENMDGLIVSYEDSELSRELSAQLIFGGVPAKGKLPVTASYAFPVGAGIETEKAVRLKYTIPEEVGIASADLKAIDSVAQYGIAEKAYPGCQLLIAKEGKVIYQKSFGNHTYGGRRVVENNDIYDLASITKIAASLPGIMKMVDEGKLDLDSSLGTYLPVLKGSNKEDMVIREVLAHQAGLQAWIPFYLKTVSGSKPSPDIYSKTQSDSFPYQVAKNLYIRHDYPEVIFERIIKSSLGTPHEYKYSDLGYFLMKEIIETTYGTPLNEFAHNNFYGPLGATTMGYRPLERFDLERLVPTEMDTYFRDQLIHGYVHDPGAAMTNGVGGHAGVFSSANDLAKLMQMYLWEGEYGGEKFLNSATIEEFSKCQFCDNGNRRGAGFDKPQTDPLQISPTCRCVSDLTFGHTGFTGTASWVDPEEELIYIFLSNRVYPNAANRKLISTGIRTVIQELIYEANSKAVKVMAERK